MRKTIAALLGAIGLVSCDDGLGSNAGELAIQLTGATAPRAVLLEVIGPQQAVTVPTGSNFQVHVAARTGDTAQVAIVAPAGSTVGPGLVARITVFDVTKVAGYRVRVMQAAGANYALLAPGAFVTTVTR